MKLVQKRFLGGRREFEITADAVEFRSIRLHKQETLTVMLAILNPEPVAKGSQLEFASRVNGHPLLSLHRDLPSRESCAAFVAELQRRADEAYRAFTGLRGNAEAGGLAANRYDEPPDFDAPGRKSRTRKPIRAESIESSIRMLEQYHGREGIEPLLDALAALQENTQDESRLDRLVAAFEALGSRQGAVLTYAPYIGILLSDDPFDY